MRCGTNRKRAATEIRGSGQDNGRSMATPTFDESGRNFNRGPAKRRFRNFPGLAGIVLTVAMLIALAVFGTLADLNRSYEAVLIEAPLAAKVRPQEPGGRLTEFQEFTLNEIIAGNDAPEETAVTGYAPSSARLTDTDFSPRVRQERSRVLSGSDLRNRSSAAASQSRTSEAQAIWRSLAPSRGDGTRKIDASEVIPGTDIAQLGDFPDETAALVKWSTLETRYPDLFAGIDWYVEDARSGGSPITRLRVSGFGAREIALWFCEELESKDETCIPTVSR